MAKCRNKVKFNKRTTAFLVVAAFSLIAAACQNGDTTEAVSPSSVPFSDTTTTTGEPETTETSTETTTTETTEPPTTTTTIPCDAPATAIAYAVTDVPDQLNIRSGAGTQNEIIGQFEPDARDIFFTADCQTVGTLAWWKLATGEGWLAARYVKPQGNSVCTDGDFISSDVTDVNVLEAEVDGDGRIDTVYTFIRDGELIVAAELGDGGYIETAYVEDPSTDFFYGFPTDLSNLRAVRPAGRAADVILADSSNEQFYMFSYRLCELPLIGGLETDGPFSFVQLSTDTLSQRLVCTIENNGTNLYMHRFGSEIDGEELLRLRFDDTYHGASTESPIAVDPDGVYWAC